MSGWNAADDRAGASKGGRHLDRGGLHPPAGTGRLIHSAANTLRVIWGAGNILGVSLPGLSFVRNGSHIPGSLLCRSSASLRSGAVGVTPNRPTTGRSSRSAGRLEPAPLRRRSGLFRFRAGQDVPGLLADDYFAIGWNEAHDQAYLALRAAGLVPRNPNAVRVPEVRLAVVLGELLLGEHVLAVRFDLVVVASGLVESIDDKLAFHLDGFFTFGVVEHQPTAKTSPGFLVGWV